MSESAYREVELSSSSVVWNEEVFVAQYSQDKKHKVQNEGARLIR